jgi:2-deoxy-D-gluconate 3-dehydrogenase
MSFEIDRHGAAASPFDLSGKVAIVTGGNGGLGLGMAAGLARAGASVAIAARRRDKAEIALQHLQDLGARALFVETDVASKASCVATAEQVAAEWGRLDILIANAGLGHGRRPEKIDEASWRELIGVNLDGVMYSAQAVYPHLKAAGGGKIVTIGSMYSLFGGAGGAAYGASKGGVVALTRSLAAAWARDNIQVNALLPGWLATEMVAGARDDAEFDQRIVSRTPAGRWGDPDDMAGAAVFLSSAASDFVTGVALPVDGGYSIMS